MSSRSRPYRSKRMQPCDACRTRRTACIRHEGEVACSLCRHRNAACTFLTRPKSRKNSGKALETPAVASADALHTGTSEVPNSDLASTMEHLDMAGAFARPDLPFTPLHMDDFDSSFLTRIDPRYLIKEKQQSSSAECWFNSSTSIPDRTCLYSGLSSDLDPQLLRSLVYDDSGFFGDNSWLVWRADRGTYLTIYQNHHLDVHTAMYARERIDSLFAPFQEDLIDLFFTYVHPSLPILGSKTTFERHRAENSMPASLLAVVYLHGSHFSSQRGLNVPDHRALQPYIYSCLTFESRTPNLAVIQAALLFMQLPARFTRAPNHPGIWSTSAMVVSMAQDVGLHAEPSTWNIIPEEQKLRRVLWWAVYAHDKSMAHWLGRPSHINANTWNVEPLQLKDFADSEDRLDVDCIGHATAFIALTNLSVILSTLLEDLYGMRSNFQTMDALDAASKVNAIRDHLRHWRSQHPLVHGSSAQPYCITVEFMALTIELSMQRALLGSNVPSEYLGESSSREILDSVSQRLFPQLDKLIQHPATGLWLNYSKGNLCTIGSLLIFLVLQSINDEALDERRAMLLDFRSRLQLLKGFEFARLPLRRLNLIIEELFGKTDGSLPVPSTNGACSISPFSGDAEENLWASYRIAFPWEE